jgi:hypothetical protein
MCRKLTDRGYTMPAPESVVKLSGDNSREEKDRVMAGFLSGWVNPSQHCTGAT